MCDQVERFIRRVEKIAKIRIWIKVELNHCLVLIKKTIKNKKKHRESETSNKENKDRARKEFEASSKFLV